MFVHMTVDANMIEDPKKLTELEKKLEKFRLDIYDYLSIISYDVLGYHMCMEDLSIILYDIIHNKLNCVYVEWKRVDKGTYEDHVYTYELMIPHIYLNDMDGFIQYMKDENIKLDQWTNEETVS